VLAGVGGGVLGLVRLVVRVFLVLCGGGGVFSVCFFFLFFWWFGLWVFFFCVLCVCGVGWVGGGGGVLGGGLAHEGFVFIFLPTFSVHEFAQNIPEVNLRFQGAWPNA